MKRLKNGKKNRLHPDKPVNISLGCDPDHRNAPWCKDCKGTKNETFECRKRALHWLASLSEKERKKALERYGNEMHPDCYR